MIKVNVFTLDSKLAIITIQGHANYADKGNDLVCAGVSSISIGMMNALNEFMQDHCELELKESYTRINVIRDHPQVQILLKAMLIQLKTMEETYPTYIKIIEQEV